MGASPAIEESAVVEEGTTLSRRIAVPLKDAGDLDVGSTSAGTLSVRSGIEENWKLR